MTLLALSVSYAGAQASPTSASPDTSVVKSVGTIKAVQADSITVAAESGGEVTAKLDASTKILRVPPGEKDLKNATALQSRDLQPGDRVLVRGKATADSHFIAALAVIVMKQADVSAKQQRERDDWRKRGADGLVSKVDVAASAITISSGGLSSGERSSGGLGAKHDVLVHVNKDTVLRRYALDSVRFEDAKPAPIEQIKEGDQLRARGNRSPDGAELNAEEIVSGRFRNIAGTITAVDAGNNSISVQDRIRKSLVTVKITSDSQVKKVPAEIAQRIAARLKGRAGANGDQPAATNAGAAKDGGPPSAGSGGPSPTNGNATPDLQRLLTRLPNSPLSDLAKGDVVMVLSTEDGDAPTVTAITLLSGVEPILASAPSRAASSLLSPWSLNASGAEGESAP